MKANRLLSRRALALVGVMLLILAGCLSLQHAFHDCEGPMECPVCRIGGHGHLLSIICVAAAVYADGLTTGPRLISGSTFFCLSQPLVALHVRLND